MGNEVPGAIFMANDVLEDTAIGVNSGIDESRFSAPRDSQDEGSRIARSANNRVLRVAKKGISRKRERE